MSRNKFTPEQRKIRQEKKLKKLIDNWNKCVKLMGNHSAVLNHKDYSVY